MWRKTTYYRSASFVALVVASATATTTFPRIAAADIVYDVNQTIQGASATGSVTGTITTNGTTGPSFFPNFDILGFNLNVSVGGQTSSLVNGVNGGGFFVSGGGLTATPTDLSFTFPPPPGAPFANFFTNPTTTACAPALTLRAGGGALCGMSGTGIGVIAVPGGPSAFMPVMAGSSLTIATVPTTPEIPLPPAIYLFGSVLVGAFWLGRRKRSTVSSLGSA